MERSEVKTPNWKNYLDSSLFHENFADYHSGHKTKIPNVPSNPTKNNQSKGNLLPTKTNKRKRCLHFCLLFFLLVMAAILSALASFLCYYFLQPGHFRRYVVSRRTHVSVPILNETFPQEYQDPNSTVFHSIAEPFCGAVDELLKKTEVYANYDGCQVTKISDGSDLRSLANSSDAVNTSCFKECRNGSFIVSFDLEFFDMEPEVLKSDLPKLIKSYANRKNSNQQEFLYLGPYLIGVNEIPSEPLLVHNAVLSKLEMPVYNFTFEPELQDNMSGAFEERAIKFCYDVDFIFRETPNYYSCKVNAFHERPAMINFELVFADNDTESIKKDIIDIINEKSYRLPIEDQKYLVLGELLVEPGNISVPLLPINITGIVNTPEPDGTIDMNVNYDGVHAEFQYGVFNLHYNESLADNGSLEFDRMASPFCGDLDWIFRNNKDIKQRYLHCAVNSFSSNPDEVHFSLTFQGNNTEFLKDQIRNAIHKEGTKVVFKKRLLTKLGSLLVLPENRVLWTPINITTTPANIRGHPFYTHLDLEISLPTLNVSFESFDFQDNTSTLFLEYGQEFCKDVDRILRKSRLSSRFLECDFLKFGRQGESVTFSLIFEGTADDRIITDVTGAIRHFGAVKEGRGKMAAYLGGILVEINLENHQIGFFNFTTTPSTTFTTTEVAQNLNLQLFVYNIKEDGMLTNSSSQEFQEISKAFCKDVKKLVLNSLNIDQSRCFFSEFSLTPLSTNLTLIFWSPKETSRKKEDIETILWLEAPTVAEGSNLYWIGNHIVSPYSAEKIPVYDGIALRSKFLVFNASKENVDYDEDFCQDLDVILRRQRNYIGCKIISFRFQSKEISFDLFWDSSNPFGIINDTLMSIRKFAPSKRVSHNSVYQLGSVWVFLKPSNMTPHILNISSIRPFYTSTTPPPTTPFVAADALLVNLTWSLNDGTKSNMTSLLNSSSPDFKFREYQFCHELKLIIHKHESLKKKDIRCSVYNYMFNPPALQFALVIEGRKLPSSALWEAVRWFAPFVNNKKNVRRIGMDAVIIDNHFSEARLVNLTDWKPLDTYTTTTTMTTVFLTTPDWSVLGDSLATNFTFTLWNMTSDPELFDRNSQAFIRINKDFCDNMRKIMNLGSLNDRFVGCDIIDFDQKNPTVRVMLIFYGTDQASDLSEMVQDSLRDYGPNARKADNARQIGQTIIWINSSMVSLHAANLSDWTTPIPTSTTTQITTPHWSQLGDSLATNLTFTLWNMTSDPELFDRNSQAFIRINKDFCDNMRKIMNLGSLNDRFVGCDIIDFDQNNPTVRVMLIFYGTDQASDLSEMVQDSLRDYGPNARKADNARQIGQTIIWINSSMVSLHAANLSDWTTPIPTSTTTQITTPHWSQLGDSLATNFTFTLWNMTSDPELFDRNSQAFIRINKDFCDNMREIMNLGSLNDRFVGCDIIDFDQKNPTVRVMLIFYGTDQASDLSEMVQDSLRDYGPNARKADNARQIGQTIIWINSSMVSLHAANLSDWTTPIPTSTTTQITTPHWSQLGDSLATNFTFTLWNMTSDPELFDRNSQAFIRINKDFCDNMRKIMNLGSLNDRFVGCDIIDFDQNNPTVRVMLIFYGTDQASDLSEMVQDSLRDYGPNARKADNARQIGQTIIWINSSIVSLHAANLSDWTTPIPTSTTTQITTPHWSQLGDSLATNFTFTLWNMTSDPELFDRNSQAFIRINKDFCDNMKKIMNLGLLNDRFVGCDIIDFDQNNPTVRVMLIFYGTDQASDLSEMVQDSLRDYGPNARKADNAIQIGQTIIWINSSMVSLHAANLSDWTTPMPTSTTTQITTPHWSQLGDIIVANVTFTTYNFSRNPSWLDFNYERFRPKADLFCQELLKITRQGMNSSNVPQKCQVYQESSSPTIEFFLVFEIRDNPSLIPREILDSIRSFRQRNNSSFLPEQVALVGPSYVWLNSTTFELFPANQTDWTHPMTTTPATPIQNWSLDNGTIEGQAMFSLYNFTMTDALRNPESEEFKRRGQEFCEQWILALKHDPNLAERVAHCNLEQLQNDRIRLNFIFFGINGNGMEKAFRDLPEPRKSSDGLLRVGGLWIWLPNMTLELGPFSTTTPIPETTTPYVFYDSIRFEGHVLLHNFSSDSSSLSLSNQNSNDFQRHTYEFCQQFKKITSSYKPPIHLSGCRISKFGFTPESVHFQLLYPSQNPEVIPTQKDWIDLIQANSPQLLTPDGQPVFRVGRLFLYLDSLNWSRQMTNQSEEEIDFVTQPMPTTLKPIVFDAIILNISAELYNLTNSSHLYQKNSFEFLVTMSAFCSELEFLLTKKKPAIYSTGCKIESFRIKPDRMRFKIMYPGDFNDVVTAREMADLIRSHSPAVATPGGEMIYPVGPLYLVLDTLNLTVHKVNESREELNSVTQIMPTTTDSTIFDTTYLRVNVGLHNFTWQPELNEHQSKVYLNQVTEFCGKIDEYFQQSPTTKNIYDGCLVNNFTNTPAKINFGLKFRGDHRRDIQDKAVDVLAEYGQHVVGLLAIKVGGLILVLDDIDTIVEMANGTDFRELTSVKMVFQTPNLNFSKEDFLPNKGSLEELPQLMCDELLQKYRQFKIEPGFVECHFKPLRPNATLEMELKYENLNQSVSEELLKNQINLLSKDIPINGRKGIVLNNIILLLTESQTTNTGVRLALFNFNFTEDLNEHESERFKRLSRNFCMDIEDFYFKSHLGRNFRGCQILSFYRNPQIGEAVLQFQVDTTQGLLPAIVRVLNESAPRVIKNGQQYLRIGDLLIIPGDMGPMGSPLGEMNWKPPQLGSVPLPGEQASTRIWLQRPRSQKKNITDRSAVLFKFDLLNFTLDARLQNHSSAYFIRQAGKFCQQIDTVFRQSKLADDYETCQVLDFTSDEPFTKMRFQLFLKDSSQLINISTAFGSALYNNFPKEDYNGMEILRVGKIKLIFPGPIQPPKQTTDFVLKVVITFNLHNFTYTDSLENSNSEDFQEKQEAFCTDLKKMYGKSSIGENFFNCSVEYFKPNPNRILFNLVFKVAEPDKVTGRDVVSTFMQVAPTVQYKGYNYFHIGGLYLRRPDSNKRTARSVSLIRTPPDLIPYEVTLSSHGQHTLSANNGHLMPRTINTKTNHNSRSPSNGLVTQYTPLDPVGATAQRKQIVIVHDATMAILRYRVLNISVLANNSMEFLELQDKLCQNFSWIFKRSMLAQLYYTCKIDQFSLLPPALTTHLVFLAPYEESLLKNVTEVLKLTTPHKNFRGQDALWIENVLLESASLNISLKAVNLTKTDLMNLSERMVRQHGPLSVDKSEVKILHYEAVLLNYSFPIINSEPKKDLKNSSSDNFREFATTFCKEVDHLMLNSILATPYHGCRLQKFTRNPRTIIFLLALRAPRSQSLIENISRIFEENAEERPDPKKGPLLHLGGLFLDYQAANVSQTLINITGSDWPARSVAQNGWLMRVVLRTYNTTFDRDFNNVSSVLFKEYSQRLCLAVEEMFQESNLSHRYAGCKIEEISNPPMKVTFRLLFREPKDILPKDVAAVLRHLRDPYTNIGRIGDVYFWMDKISLEYKPTHVPDIDPCSPDKNGDYLSHPTSCTKFIECKDGRSHVTACKPGFVFESKIKKCIAQSESIKCFEKKH